MEFEWDPAKAKANLAKHGVSFDEAKAVFADSNAIELLEENSGEERWRILGRAVSAILMVVYAERGGRIRIISARKASKREQKAYLKQEDR